jgi:hypothetical protein
MGTPPILANKLASASSVFTPAALLREARRQKGLQDVDLARRDMRFHIAYLSRVTPGARSANFLLAESIAIG